MGEEEEALEECGILCWDAGYITVIIYAGVITGTFGCWNDPVSRG